MPRVGQTVKTGRRSVFLLGALAQLTLLVFSLGLISGCNSVNNNSDAKLLWKYSAPRRSHWTTNGSGERPVIAGDTILYTGGYPDRNEVFLNAVDLKTGQKRWSTPHSVSQFSISGDSVFYSTIDSMTKPQPGKKKKEWVRCVDLASGKLKWEKLIETNYGSLQFLSDNSYLYLFFNEAEICGMNKATGEIAWQQTLPSISSNSKYSAPSVAASGDIIFVAMPNHTISVIDGATGKLKSVIPGLRAPSDGGTRTILPAGNSIVLVDSDGFVSTVNGNTARISTPVAAGYLEGPPSIDDNALYLSASEQGPNTKTPSEKLDYNKTKFPYSTKKPEQSVASGPIAPPAQRYLCAIAVDTVAPNFKWQTNVNGLVHEPPVLDEKMLLVGTADGERQGEVLALKKGTGQLLWSYDSGPVTGRPVVDANVVFASGKEGLLAIDASTGKLLWKYQLENTTPAAGPIISGSTLLLVGRDSNLYAIKVAKAPTKDSRESATTQDTSATQ